MMMNNTLTQLHDLKLAGMLAAVEEQLSGGSAAATLSFEERLALMVDREVHYRGDKRRAALLKKAGLKYPQACIEDVDGRAGRGFERSTLMSLASGPRRGPCVALGVGSRTVLRSWSPVPRAQASRGWPVRWRNTRVGVGTRRCICARPAWSKNCASCMATAASLAG